MNLTCTHFFICHLHYISYYNKSCVLLSHLRHVQLFGILWIRAHQAPLSMGFSRQGYWSGLPCSPSGNFPNPGIEPVSLMSPALAGGFFTTSTTWKAPRHMNISGWGEPQSIYRTIPQRKLKNDFFFLFYFIFKPQTLY